MDQSTSRKVIDVLPEVAEDLVRGLTDEARTDLIDQVKLLEIRAMCRCNDYFCASFYTTSPGKVRSAGVQETIVFERRDYVECVDLIDNQIVYVEIISNAGAIKPKVTPLFD